MTRAQNTVIWLGLVLVALNIIVHIGDVKSVIFGTADTSAANKPAGNVVQPAQPGNAPQPTPQPNIAPNPQPQVL